jgi:hypothetical protein
MVLRPYISPASSLFVRRSKYKDMAFVPVPYAMLLQALDGAPDRWRGDEAEAAEPEQTKLSRHGFNRSAHSGVIWIFGDCYEHSLMAVMIGIYLMRHAEACVSDCLDFPQGECRAN